MINPPSNIPLSYIPKAIIEFLSTQGVASSEALRNTAIEQYLLDTTNEKVSFAQLSQIFHNCVHSLGSGCGIQAGAYIPWCFYGTLGETVNCSHSLFAVGLAFRRYVILTQPYYFHYYRTPNYHLTRDQHIVCPVPELELGHCSKFSRKFEFELRLATTLKLFKSCGFCSDPESAFHVKLNTLHSYCQDYIKAYFNVSVEIHQGPTQISSAIDVFTQKWRPLRRPIFIKLLEALENEYQREYPDNSFTELVRWQVCKSFVNSPSLACIAYQLNISRRTLTRKLTLEQTSFREILNEVRMEIACRHICDSELGVDTVAEIMGFSSGSSLRRAIKTWTGKTPLQLKEQSEKRHCAQMS